MSDARKAPEQGPRQGAQDEPWWADAMRALAGGESIRSVARSFATNPRRVRRALARASVRAGGKATHRGLPALAAIRERLGREPDGVLAKVTGLIPEAVAGERRRLRIRPFRPVAKGVLTPDESAWVRGPVRSGRIKAKPNEDVLIVHRAVRPEFAPRESGRDPIRPEINPREPVRSSVIRRPPQADAPVPKPTPAQNESTASVFLYPRGVQTIRSQGPAGPVVLGRDTESPINATRGLATAPAHIRMRVESQSERQREIDELLNAPKRDREGRQRIVRAETGPMIEPTPPPPEPSGAVRKRSDLPAWRAVPEPAVLLASTAVVTPPPVAAPAAAPSKPAAAPKPAVSPAQKLVVTPPPVAAPAAAPSKPAAAPKPAVSPAQKPVVTPLPVAAPAGSPPPKPVATLPAVVAPPEPTPAPAAVVAVKPPTKQKKERGPRAADQGVLAGPLTRTAFLLLFPDDPFSIAFNAALSGTAPTPPTAAPTPPTAAPTPPTAAPTAPTRPMAPPPVRSDPAPVATAAARRAAKSQRAIASRNPPPAQLSLGLERSSSNLHFHVWCNLFGTPLDVHAPNVEAALDIAAKLLAGLPGEITSVERV